MFVFRACLSAGQMKCKMKKIIFFLSGCLMSGILTAQYSIKGKVTGENEKVLSGVHVKMDELIMGSSTNEEGVYQLKKIPPGNYTLVFTMVGYEKETRKIELRSGDVELNVQMKPSVNQLEEITIETARVNEEKGIAFTNIEKADLEKNNLGQDVPYLLDQSPSVVVTSDAGAGIGYTGIRIRGSDPTRINLTLNGIPLNDAESQGTFLVNLPDFSSSVDHVQIQRGVGTSANGAGAFGASINLSTNSFNEKSYGEIIHSFGSFNTQRYTFKAGSGLINEKFTFDMRLSSITSDGYIERASSDLKSFYTSAAWYGKKSNLRLNIFSGKEKTYQAWGGVPYDSLKTNRRYNPYTYENETDNYWQTHYHLFFNQEFSPKLYLSLALHYTRGYGYYEQYKEDIDFASLGLSDPVIGTDTVSSTDLIRQRWLDNHFYGTIFNLSFKPNSKMDFVFGGGANQYNGDHFGEIIWAETAQQLPAGFRYYENNGEKTDVNFYIKADYRLRKKLTLYADIQQRLVEYAFLGIDNNGISLQQKVKHAFFNPKAGMVYRVSDHHSTYVSFGVGNKEPNRDDYVSNPPASQPVAESLYDTEAGYRFRNSRISAGANLYYMYYKNQLALNGQINDVGNYIRSNIGESYRRGIELDAAFQFTKKIAYRMNATLSQNRVVEYNEYVDNWDTGMQDTVRYKNTELAFSPSVIAYSELTLNVFSFNQSDESKKSGSLELSIINKYVGKQYMDNSAVAGEKTDVLTGTELKYRTLDAYFLSDIRLSFQLKIPGSVQANIHVLARNVLDVMYSSNAWIYKYAYGGTYGNTSGYYPQAGRNFLAGITLKF